MIKLNTYLFRFILSIICFGFFASAGLRSQTIIDHVVPVGATFEYTTTVNVPAGASFVNISAWGGGGGGNGSAQLQPQMIVGGGGGAFSRITKYPVKPGDVLSVSVGRGGGVLASGGFANTGLSGGATTVSLNGTPIIIACAGPRYFVISGNYEFISCNPLGEIEKGAKTYTGFGGDAGGISSGGGKGGFPGSDGNVPGGGGGAGVGGQLAGKGASGRVIIDFLQGGETCDITISPSSPIICKGESISLTASGASTYTWSPSSGLSDISGATVTANPSSTVTYTVTGKSASGACTSSQTVTLNVNQPEKITLIQNPPGISDLCGGEIVLTVPAGYTNIFWADGSTSQSLKISAQGSYFVKAKNQNGCQSFSDTLTYKNSGLPMVTISPSSEIYLCNPPVTLTANDGLFNYEWSNGATGRKADLISPGTYFVTAKNASGCKGKSEEVIVNAGYTLQVSVSADKNYVCSGDSLTISPSASFFNYKWSDGSETRDIRVKKSGTYSLVVKDAKGCTGSSNAIEILPKNKPKADFSFLQTDLKSVQFTNLSINANDYLWRFGEGSSSQATSPEFNFPEDKVYTTTLVANNECGSDSVSKIVSLIKTGISSRETFLPIVYPNPAKDFIIIEKEKGFSADFSLDIYNALGQKILSPQLQMKGKNQVRYDISDCKPGTYIFKIRNENNMDVRRVIIQ